MSASPSASAVTLTWHYLASSQVSKEDFARQVQQRDGIEQGLICVLGCVEPCLGYDIHRNREKARLELVLRLRKGLHLYHYSIDPVFGFMHTRLQTWFPFGFQVCLNGREWLARQLDAHHVRYQREKNCFRWIEDFPQAQRLIDLQLTTSWPRELERLRQRVHPVLEELFPEPHLRYYWSVYQMEWASDLAFERPGALAEIFPPIVRHAITSFSSTDVMRFLGQKLSGNFSGEVVSDYKCRPEGVRVKHRVKSNSVKIYDKQRSVLRVETTINNPRDLKSFRRPEGKPHKPRSWRPLRKGVADLKRVSQLSQRANNSYLDALAALEDRTPVHQLVDKVCRPTTWNGKRVRALRPWSTPDLKLFELLQRGEFVLHGFRNCDLRLLLFPSISDLAARKRQAAQVTRLLRLLRAHHLLRKLPRTHRYQLTPRGRSIVTAILAARQATLADLLKAVA